MQSPSTGGIRFAPSPTGQFHVGNLRTAWISSQFSKKFNLPWIVRFEDIDQPRVLATAKEQQLSDLQDLGLIPSIELLQTNFRERHWELFIEAVASKKVYPCDCSRKDIQAALSMMASAPHSVQPTYSGNCRLENGKLLRPVDSLAWRFKMPDPSGKDDFIIGRTSKQINSEGIPDQATYTPAYQWACAIDDHDGDYHLLVRSSDLKDSIIPQRAIQNWLGRKKPIQVFHTSLVTQNDGQRLEKRTAGVTLNEIKNLGISSTALIEIFQKSFDFELLKLDSSGEREEKISLQELGL